MNLSAGRVLLGALAGFPLLFAAVCGEWGAFFALLVVLLGIIKFTRES